MTRPQPFRHSPNLLSRYIDSNGYSLRTANQDLALVPACGFSRQVGEELQLAGDEPSWRPKRSLVGRGKANRA